MIQLKPLFAVILLIFPFLSWSQEDTKVFRSIDAGMDAPEEVKILELNRKDFSALPGDISLFVNLEELRLKYCRQLNFENAFDQLAELKHLKRLDISWNGLQVLPENIDTLGNLEVLDLSENKIHTLPSAVGRMVHLRKVELKHNIYLDIERAIGVLGQLPELSWLDLSYCHLTELPSAIGQLSELTHLNLEGNYILNLPAEFGNLGKLRYLSLRKNFDYSDVEEGRPTVQLLRQDSLFNNLGKLTSLDSLDLAQCQLREIASSIRKLGSLRYLNLQKNRLHGLPSQIGDLENLEYLNVSNPGSSNRTNQLTSLPSSFSKLENLRHLDLSANEFKDFSLKGPLPSLEVLRLSWNRLESFPEALREMSQLKVLELNVNLITELPEWIGELAQLEHFEINGDFFLNPSYKIESVPEAITQLGNLRVLKMNDQVIRSLPADMGSLTQLEILEVKDNLLQEIPESIGNCGRLKQIDLKANELRELPMTFNKLDSLETLNLSFNIELSGMTIVPALRECASLKKLDITFTARISKEELSRIREALDGTTVVFAVVRR